MSIALESIKGQGDPFRFPHPLQGSCFSIKAVVKENMATREQNLAKFLYDIAKLIFGGFVVATILAKGSATFLILFGVAITALVAIIAFWIDKGA
jgi:hypothetical protein